MKAPRADGEDVLVFSRLISDLLEWAARAGEGRPHGPRGGAGWMRNGRTKPPHEEHQMRGTIKRVMYQRGCRPDIAGGPTMNRTSVGPSPDAPGRHAKARHPAPPGPLRCWGAVLVAATILQACDQASPKRDGGPPTAREDQVEVARLREFVDLLHREIEQLHTDKQRLTEELERRRLENAALRAGTVKPAPAARRAEMGARP